MTPLDIDPAKLLLTEQRITAELAKRQNRKKQSQRGGLIEFVRYFWKVLEPNTPFVEGWPLEAICQHLEAVHFGEITRLLINVPPGFMKSLLTDVFFPAWIWGPMNEPHTRFVTFSYASSLTQRDNGKFRDLLISPEFKELWGSRLEVKTVGVERVSNDHTGWKFASSVGGVGTGERGDYVILDDPINVKDAESETVRNETNRWFRESMSNRLNDMDKSAIVIIMQRVHEDDVSGLILSSGMDYVHLMIPMEFDETRCCETDIGWIDPRTIDGELAWPDRFSADVVETMQKNLGPYAYAGQYDQAPTPRGGGIFKREWWQVWEPKDGKFPQFDYIVASLDSAFTEKEENDPSGMTVWGVWTDIEGTGQFDPDTGKIWRRPGPGIGQPKVMLIKAWRKHLEMHGTVVEQERDESYRQWRRRAERQWGLCEWVAETCRFRNAEGVIVGTCDKLLIEAKASGISAAQEIQRLYGNDGWVTQLEQVKGDKVARAHSVVPLFSNGLVYAPDKEFAELVIDEMAVFPKGRYKDLTDSCTQGLRHIRSLGLIQRKEDIEADTRYAVRHRKKQQPLYQV